MTVLVHRLPPLAGFTSTPEMFPDGFLFLPPLPADRGVAVPFSIDDKFYSHSKVLAVSLAARGLWATVGAWSSDHRKGGDVPDRVLAAYGCTPELEAELLTAGLWKRIKRGIRFHDWEQWNDTVEQAEAREAEQARRRELGRARAQRKRERDRAGRAAVMAEGVTRDAEAEAPASRSPKRGVTRPGDTARKKPQVTRRAVTRYEGVTSRVTAQRDASDLDQDQSSGVGQINARAREAIDPADVALVMRLASAKLKRDVSAVESCRAIRVWETRAEDAGKVIHDRPKFFERCAERERRLELILAPPPNPLWVELGTAPEPPPGAHVYEPESPFGDSCAHLGCGLKKTNARHINQEANTG